MVRFLRDEGGELSRTTMTSRERLQAALRHEPVDRVPLDIGGSFATGINILAYKKVCSASHKGLAVLLDAHAAFPLYSASLEASSY